MKRSAIFSLQLFCAVGLVLAGCAWTASIRPGPVPSSTPAGQEPSECLPPLVDFAFPVGVIDDLGDVVPHPPTLPPAYWEPQVNLPEEFNFAFWKDSIVIVGDKIWVSGYIGGDLNAPAILVFDPGNGASMMVTSSQATPSLIPEKLLVAADGSLWGLGIDGASGPEPADSELDRPLLNRYDPSTGTFEPVEDVDHLLHEDWTDYSGIRAVDQDQQGRLWLLVMNDSIQGLYVFDPATRRAEQAVAMPRPLLFEDIAVVSDGSVWITETNGDSPLLRYFPESGLLQPYQGTFSYATNNIGGDDLPVYGGYGPLHLHLDRENRLWVDDKGWLANPEADRPQWYRVVRSPVFIEGWVDGVGNFYWSSPLSTFESSDGRFWFAAGVGTVRLDPQNGQWCLFSTYTSPVVEDGDHNLWMVADGQLYKYSLEP